MARLPYPEPRDLSEPAREALARVPGPLNVFRMLAHAETAFRPWLAFGGAILSSLELDPRLRELVILRVARHSGAEYEWLQHVAIARATGATAEEVEALERDDAAAACFGGEEQLVLRFTDEVVREVRASDETLRAMRERFSPREIVELLLTIGQYMLVARVAETTGIEVDDPADVLGSASRRG
jgi:AhpD family alkylhydroperoxidase